MLFKVAKSFKKHAKLPKNFLCFKSVEIFYFRCYYIIYNIKVDENGSLQFFNNTSK